MSRPVERESNQEFWTHSTTMSLIGASWEFAVIKPFSFRPFSFFFEAEYKWLEYILSPDTHAIHKHTSCTHTFIYLWIDWGNSSKMYFELNFLLQKYSYTYCFLGTGFQKQWRFCVTGTLFLSQSVSIFWPFLSPSLPFLQSLGRHCYAPECCLVHNFLSLSDFLNLNGFKLTEKKKKLF